MQQKIRKGESASLQMKKSLKNKMGQQMDLVKLTQKRKLWKQMVSQGFHKTEKQKL